MDELRQTAKATKFHFVLDAVGLSQTFEAAQEMVARNGKVRSLLRVARWC
jgi:D-arabinose 1-dehydrogenase-like Zn-dependent alcohol dehydrogenase